MGGCGPGPLGGREAVGAGLASDRVRGAGGAGAGGAGAAGVDAQHRPPFPWSGWGPRPRRGRRGRRPCPRSSPRAPGTRLLAAPWEDRPPSGRAHASAGSDPGGRPHRLVSPPGLAPADPAVRPECQLGRRRLLGVAGSPACPGAAGRAGGCAAVPPLPTWAPRPHCRRRAFVPAGFEGLFRAL